MHKPLRILQVGIGAWGFDWAWRVIPSVPEVEPVGYVDADAAALARLAERLPEARGRCFDSLAAAVDATEPEAVVITTTVAGHEPLTRAALEAGLHVLVEKPFTESLASARGLVELAEATGRVLMVSQNYRFYPAPRAVAALLAERSLGDLYEVSIDFRRNDPSPPKPRRRHHSDAQPLLLDMSIHHFDLLRYLLEREADSVLCEAISPSWSGYAGPPAALATIDFDGVAVSYRGSWISAGPSTNWAGDWRMEFEHGEVHWTSRGELDQPNERVVIRPRRGRARVVPVPDVSRIDRWGTLTEFAAALREGREPETSGRRNLGTMALVTSAVESARVGSRVQVPSVAPSSHEVAIEA
jgi:predicted dehydrogenase